MKFDITIAHEACCTRVVAIGEPVLGQLLSLLQVLEVDSASWPRDVLLLDLRGLRSPLARDDQSQLAGEAARVLRRLRRIAVVAAAADQHEEGGVRFYEDADAALGWLAQG